MRCFHPLSGGQRLLELEVNRRRVRTDAAEDTPLLWVLRDHLGLTGTKFGCGVGLCGACTVHIDGQAQRACQIPLSAIAAGPGEPVPSIETIEHHAGREGAVADAWIEEQVPQCGYCQPGVIMAVIALLERNPDPSDADVDRVITNLCRCGTYPRMRRGIRRAAAKLLEASRVDHMAPRPANADDV